MFVSNFSVAASYSTRGLAPSPAAPSLCPDQAECCKAEAETETSNWSYASALTANFDPWVWPSKSDHGDSASGAGALSASASTSASVSSSASGSGSGSSKASAKTCQGGNVSFPKEGGLLGGKVKTGECCASDTNKKTNECKADSKTGGSKSGGSK